MPALSTWKMFNDQDPAGAQEFFLSVSGRDLPLSDNFTLGEFACRDGSDRVLVHPALVAVLQCVRDHFGKPVRINSAYRTKAYNASIGGAKSSKHVLGMAADIVVKGVDHEDVAEFLEEYDVGGLGRYNTFTHVDVFGVMRRWDERS